MSTVLRIIRWMIPALIGLSVLIGVFGCSLLSKAVPPAPTDTPTALPSATLDLGGTRTAEASARAKSTADAKSTEGALQASASTATAGFISTGTAQASSTESTRNTEIAQSLQKTFEAIDATKTAQVGGMAKVVQKLKEEGYLTKTSGSYHLLEDFDKSWAQINWYRWSYVDHSPDEFVIRADASWDSASNVANWFNSGCGFVYGEQDRYNHHLVFWGLDGNVYAERVSDGYFIPLGRGYYGPVDTPRGEARIMLVVENRMLTAFADGRKILRVSDPYYNGGDLAITLLSGTNKDFGTRCTMKNIELWWLE